MVRTSALAGLAAAVLLLGACGSGDGDEDTSQAADSRTEDQRADDQAGAGGEQADDDRTDDDRDDAEAAPERITSDGGYRCDGGDVAIQGINLEVTLTGECAAVTITGSGHDVEVESAETITLNGTDHDLDYEGDAEVVDNSIGSDID